MDFEILKDFNSYTNNKWQLKSFDERQAELISQKFDTSYLIAKLFSIRQISVDDISSYLNPTLKDNIPDPNILVDMDKACERLLVAIRNKEKIAIIGDYDVDGSSATSLFNIFGLIPWNPPSFLIIGIWPILMGASMWVQQKLNPAPADPIQAKIFAFFPIFLTIILASFPSGLVVYWTVNNILTIAQQWVIMKKTTVKTN